MVKCPRDLRFQKTYSSRTGQYYMARQNRDKTVKGTPRRRFLRASTCFVVASVAGVGAGSVESFASEETGGEIVWQFSDPDGVSYSPAVTINSPTVVDGTVYVGAIDGLNGDSLYAVDAETGEEVWKLTESLGAVDSSPTVVDGTVFVGSLNGTLYAVDGETGEKEWEFTEPSASIYSSPTVIDGTVYVGSDDSNLYAVDADTGERKWVFDEPSRDVRSSPTVIDGTIYVGSHDSTLYAIDAETGDELWRFAEPSSHIVSSPTVVDGTAYFGSNEGVDGGAVYAVDAETETATEADEWEFSEEARERFNTHADEIWSFTEPSERVDSSPTVADGTVYVGSHDGTLYAVNAQTGEHEWRFTEPSGKIHSSPTVADGTVYVGTDEYTETDTRGAPERDGTLYAVDAETGQKKWGFTEPHDLVRSSPVVVEGTVYFGSYDGNLYAVDAGVSGSSEGSRVSLGTLGHHDGWRGKSAGDTEDNKDTEDADQEPDESNAVRGKESPEGYDRSRTGEEKNADENNESSGSKKEEGLPGMGTTTALVGLATGSYLLSRRRKSEKKDVEID
jgi:outer membrane protein assembly factor BamB